MSNARNPRGRSQSPLDRFGTHRKFITEGKLSDITNGPHGSLAAGIVWFVLWDLADSWTGVVRGVSYDRLIELTGLSRLSVRRAVRLLIDRKHLFLEADSYDRVYRLKHEMKAPPDGEKVTE